MWRSGRIGYCNEASGLAFVVMRGCGGATEGQRPILMVEPRSIHSRVPLVVGGTAEVVMLQRLIRASA